MNSTLFRTRASALFQPPLALMACLRSLIIALVALGLSPIAHSSITIQSYWPLGEAAAIGTDTTNVNDGTLNPFNNTTGSTILTATPSGAAGSTAYAHASGTNYQGIWMFGAGATAQTVPADNWGVQFNVRSTTAFTGWRAVFGMAEGVSAGLVIEANNVNGTVYWDVNAQGVANRITPRNAAVTVVQNVWYNLALVKNGGTTSFYVNGVSVGSTATAINTSGLLAFAFQQNVGTNHFTGDFDEARFFTFAAGAFTTADLSMTKRTVTYAGNGNTGGTAPVDSGSYFSGTPVTVLGAGTLTRTGYIFSNWNTVALGGGTSYSPAATFNIADANTTLYAQWTAATATITAAATLPGTISSTYGTASGSTSEAVSGSNLAADLTATAPANLEISSDNITFGTTVTFTHSGGSAGGTIYVRLKDNAPVSSSPYNGQAVALTSSGATPVNVATTASGNTVTAKVLTVASATAQDKMQDGSTTGTVTGTLLTAEAFGTGNSGDGIPYIGDTLTVSAPGTFSSAAAGGPYTVTPGTFTLGGSATGNYTLDQPAGLPPLSASILNTATWTNLAGGAWNSGANWLHGVIGTGANNTANFGTLDLGAAATVTLTGPQTIGSLVFADTTPDNNWLITGSTLTLAASSTPTINVTNQTATINSALTGTSGMSKTGAGILALTANTSGAMNLTANNGTLKLAVAGLAYNNAGGVGNGGTLTVNPGATLQIGGGYNIGYQQAVNINGGTLDLSNNSGGDGQNYTLNLNLSNGGSIISSSASSLRWGELANAAITVNGSTPATISSNLRMIPGNSRTGTINVVDAAGSLNFTGAIIDYPGIPGGVPLSKTGAGTLTLAGTNAYTSTTTVNGGTLQVNGSLSGSAITVQTGATLSGTGSIGSLTTIKNGGTISPGGAAIGTLTINNTLILETGATTSLQIDKTGGTLTNDQLAASAVAYQGTLQITASGETLIPGDSFTLFNGVTFSGAFTSYILPTLAAGYSWDVSRLTLDGSVYVTDTLPTPTFSLVSGGYIGAQTVTLSDSTAGTTIYYEFTTDGSVPNDPTQWSTHQGPAGSSSATLSIPVETGMSIKAFAIKTGSLASPIASAEYFAVTTPLWTMDGSGSWSDPNNWLHGAIATGSGVIADFSTLTLSGAATVTLDSPHTLGGLAFGDLGDAQTWTLAPSGGSVMTLASDLGTPTISVANQSATVSVALAGLQGLVKTGNGTLTLTGNNTFAGDVTISGGVLATTGGNSTKTYLGPNVAGRTVTVGPATTLLIGSATLWGNESDAPANVDLVVNGGTVKTVNMFSRIGNVTLNGGTLTDGGGAYSGYRSLDFGDLTGGASATVTVTGSIPSVINTAAGGSNYGMHLGTSTVFNVADVTHSTASDLSVSASLINPNSNVGGSGGLTKIGAGTMLLGGTNTYTGATTVNGGTLVINGAITSDVTVNATATLGGSGSSTGSLTIAASAILAPGSNGIGTFAAGTTTLAGTYDCQLDAATSDSLAVTGDLTITAGSLAIQGTPTAASLVIASYSGTLTGTFASVTGLPTGYSINYGTGTNSQIKITKPGYESWVAGFPGIGDPAPAADPDGDGISNLMEYVLGGDPRVSSTSILPTQTSDGTNLVLSYKRSDASMTDTVQVGQWSNDLVTWHDVTPVVVNENLTESDDMTVSVPLTHAVNGILFARLSVVTIP